MYAIKEKAFVHHINPAKVEKLVLVTRSTMILMAYLLFLKSADVIKIARQLVIFDQRSEKVV